MSFRRAFCLAPFVLASFACSSSSSAPADAPPVIDGADAPATVTASGGAYTVDLTLKFHDPDKDAITKVRLRIPSAQVDQSQDIQNANPDAPGALIRFAISAAAPKQAYDYDVSVIDARGAESAAVTKTITLQ